MNDRRRQIFKAMDIVTNAPGCIDMYTYDEDDGSILDGSNVVDIDEVGIRCPDCNAIYSVKEKYRIAVTEDCSQVYCLCGKCKSGFSYLRIGNSIVVGSYRNEDPYIVAECAEDLKKIPADERWPFIMFTGGKCE